MKKFLIIVFLIFSGLGLMLETVMGFKEIRVTYHSLNFTQHFEVKKLYYQYFYSGQVSGHGVGTTVIVGCLENSKNEMSLRVSDKSFRAFLKNDTERDNAVYFDVWYNQELNRIFLKTNDAGFFDYDGLFIVIMWIFSIPAIIYLIKNKKSRK